MLSRMPRMANFQKAVYNAASPMFGKGRNMPGAEKYAWDKMTGKTVDLASAVGRQRQRYGNNNPQSMLGMVRNHIGGNRPSMLSRRLHSGDLNMINRRRRVQPRKMEGPPRLSYRNTQQNKGTFGIGQGINR